MPEFELIRQLQDIITVPTPDAGNGVVLGIGDDAAVLNVPAGRQLVICTDTLVEAVHFPVAASARAVGYKSLAVNLSDLAAMGAEPAWFFLALTLPQGDPAWVDGFAHGMAGLAREAGIVLAGGDTTSGGLSITITVVGLAEPGRVLTRGGARPGDRVLVSGQPGRAALALKQLAAAEQPSEACRTALEYPTPRLALGTALRGLASACIDLSDGLAADLGHILECSGTGATLDLGRLPCPECLSALADEDRWSLQLSGGDDYELCFTISPDKMDAVLALEAKLGIALTEIGEITESPGLLFNRPGGEPFEPGAAGYQHFAQKNEEARES